MRRVRRWLAEQFWALPLGCALAAAGLGLGLTALDEALGTSFTLPFLFAGGPEGARALLSAVITSMISFTGLVFSITIVVLQLTSSQFSPRVLHMFLHDRFNQFALGVFVATFVYGLVVLRAVRGTAQVDPFVPQVAVTTSFGFVITSVVVFLAYIHHITQTIRAATIIATIGKETADLLERRFPADAAHGYDQSRGQDRGRGPVAQVPSGPVNLVEAPQAGVVLRVDDDVLLALAEDSGSTLRLLRAVGEFVPTGAPLIAVHGQRLPGEDRLRRAVHLGTERSMEEDVGFGLRQLVDIAERALSPGVNDPTTAVQVIDQVHDLLRRLVTRPLRPRSRLARDGRLAVLVPQPSLEDYLTLACEEVHRWGSEDQRILRRLSVMLHDLLLAARAEHRPAVERALGRWGDASAAGDTTGEPLPSDVGLR